MDALTAQQLVQMERRIDGLQKPEKSPDLISPFLALPGLRAYWPMSSAGSGGGAADLSAQARTLTYNGNPTYSYDGVAPYIRFDGTGDYLSRADEAGLDLIGNESYVLTASRGFTIGGWFYPEDVATGFQGVMTKGDNTINNDNFRIFNNAGTLLCQMHNGANTYPVSQAIPAVDAWYFWVFRFVPSTTIDCWQNGVKATFAVAIPATANNSTAPFNIGALNGGAAAALYTGRAEGCFYCAMQLSDAIISSIFQQTRAAFRV